MCLMLVLHSPVFYLITADMYFFKYRLKSGKVYFKADNSVKFSKKSTLVSALQNKQPKKHKRTHNLTNLALKYSYCVTIKLPIRFCN